MQNLLSSVSVLVAGLGAMAWLGAFRRAWAPAFWGAFAMSATLGMLGGALLDHWGAITEVTEFIHRSEQGLGFAASIAVMVFPEELIKGAATLLLFFNFRARPWTRREMVRLSVASAIGFAVAESLHHFFIGQRTGAVYQLGWLRPLAMGFHAVCGAIMGGGLAQSVARRQRRWFVGGLLAAFGAHFFWDFFFLSLLKIGKTQTFEWLLVLFVVFQVFYSGAFWLYDRWREVGPATEPRPRALTVLLWATCGSTVLLLVVNVLRWKSVSEGVFTSFGNAVWALTIWRAFYGEPWARRSMLVNNFLVVALGMPWLRKDRLLAASTWVVVVVALAVFVYLFTPQGRRYYACPNYPK